MKQLLFIFIAVFLLLQGNAQTSLPTQTIRGTIKDKASGTTLPGAIVAVIDVNPPMGTTTDMDGNFKLTNVPIGAHTLKITFTGYKEIIWPNVNVNSGKELVLNPEMEEDIRTVQEVVITAEEKKNQPLNTMASVSARTFSVEETQKFAAAVNDPGRMVTSFAGVVSADDGNNNVSIRGNSPTGLLWRMEGVVIPNPNHFAQAAGSGGGISILSAQLLDNSDFFTGAFPAEYGNALGGVFDLRIRKGNNEKHEYTAQAGFLGLNFAAEGPLSARRRGSYLVNYRYSTLSLLQAGGLNIGGAVTNFQDVSWNFHLPTTKAGTFSVFGFIGLSDQRQNAKRDSSTWENGFNAHDQKFYSNTGSLSVKHVINLSQKTYWQNSITMGGHLQGFTANKLMEAYRPEFRYREAFINKRVMYASVLNHKWNAKNSVRAGVYYTQFLYNLENTFFDESERLVKTPLDIDGTTGLAQAFAQWKFRASERLTTNLGVHSMYLARNGSYTIEPRAGVQYALTERSKLTGGYGLHSQMQSLGVLLAQVKNADGTVRYPNDRLGFNKAHHLVLGYEYNISKWMYAKTEVYYQWLYNIAIGASPGSTFSTLNVTDAYVPDPMSNNGKGRNYGVEFTLEQFTRNGLYFLWSNSLYNSEYLAQDGVWRKTRFNAGYSSVFTAGKEWAVGNADKHKTFSVNVRSVFMGGMRRTPIDVEASRQSGEEVQISALAYSIRNRDYFRTDLRLALKRNRTRTTTTISIDFQNVTNRVNEGGQYFDVQSGQVKSWNQTPLIPVFNYRIDF